MLRWLAVCLPTPISFSHDSESIPHPERTRSSIRHPEPKAKDPFLTRHPEPKAKDPFLTRHPEPKAKDPVFRVEEKILRPTASE